MKQYHFTSIWKIEAPVEVVWKAIYDSNDWPKWWWAVRKAETLQKNGPDGTGGIKIYCFGIPIYSLCFRARQIECIYPEKIRIYASGDLNGTGTWTFTQKGRTTLIRYDWDVQINIRWMNQLAPLLNPLYRFNHNLIMRQGEIGLRKWVKES